MLKIYKLLLSTFLFVLFNANFLFATHNRAGDIAVSPDTEDCSSLGVVAVITTYTKASPPAIDRDSLEICWGDGTCTLVGRDNNGGFGELIENDSRKNVYIAYHTYNARSTYTISMLDPNRNNDILNVNGGNSDGQEFYIHTVYTMSNPNTQGCNHTPILEQPPVDIGCVGQVFTHNPNAYDPDLGDSLAYRLTIPLKRLGQAVDGYKAPHLIIAGPNNNPITINESNGDIVWDAPQKAGEYNIAMLIISYRGGVAIDTIIRDMQILIKPPCDNLPPVIEVPFDEICVVAGDLLSFNVTATAPLIEEGQKVRLTALGAPFIQVHSPAIFVDENGQWEEDPVVKTFTWQTTCEHISSQYYSVVFKAVDDFFGPSSGLATLKTIRIKIVGPPPEDVQAETGTGRVEITWKKPYTCDETEGDYFKGFSIWRRNSSNNFTVDTCEPGLAGKGYTKINILLIKDVNVADRYTFTDNTVEAGRTYCYRVLAQFALTTPDGLNTYNKVESLPSDEICVQIGRDIPLITNVDVQTTDAFEGKIGVCWAKPKLPDLDTIAHPGPYVYEVIRATGQTENEANFSPIGVSFSSLYFATANDTCFVDEGLNTIDNPYTYEINFYANDELIGTTQAASSVYLSTAPTDNASILSWEALVPWDNYEYTIFRKDPGATGFLEIAVTTAKNYRDTGLLNEMEYCYKVQSVGTYNIIGVLDTLLNNSQEKCETPFDNVPPCPPTLIVENICDEDFNCNEITELINTLIWTNPIDICEETDDVVGYYVYYAPTIADDYTLIANIDNADVLTFEHIPDVGIAGCYYVTAIDTVLNESMGSDTVCVDNCPFYELPNTFTPNGDGQNDIFTSFPYCFVEKVDFKVYNQWGELVFEAEDPDLNWDGNNLRGKALSEGVYFYTCRVFEQRVEGITIRPEILKGYIELIRGR